MRTDKNSKENGRANSPRHASSPSSRSEDASRRRSSSRKRAQWRTRFAEPSQEVSRCFYEVVQGGVKVGSLADKRLRLTRRILFLGRRWRNLMDEALRAMGDSHARWVTLLWVDMMAGRANLGELAEQIAVELPTLVRLLNRLEREELLTRRALGDSNRQKTVVLTAKGRSALARMSKVIERTHASFLEDVDHRRLDAALGVLDDVLAKYARVIMWPGKLDYRGLE